MGSFGSSAILSMAGSRSQLAGVFAAVMLFVAITLLMDAFVYTPVASLAGLVIYTMYNSLPRPRTLYKNWRLSSTYSLIWIVSLVTALTYSLEWALYIGLILKTLLHFAPTSRTPSIQTEVPYPGVFVYRFGEDSCYLNQEYHLDTLSEHIRNNTRLVKPAVKKPWEWLWNKPTDTTSEQKDLLPCFRAIVFDFNGVKGLDFESVEGLVRLRGALDVSTEPGLAEWHFANVHNCWIKRTLIEAGFGTETHHEDLQDAVDVATKNAREKDLVSAA